MGRLDSCSLSRIVRGHLIALSLLIYCWGIKLPTFCPHPCKRPLRASPPSGASTLPDDAGEVITAETEAQSSRPANDPDCLGMQSLAVMDMRRERM